MFVSTGNPVISLGCSWLDLGTGSMSMASTLLGLREVMEDWHSRGSFSSEQISSRISPSSPWLIQHSGLRQWSIPSGTPLPHTQSVVHSTIVLASVQLIRMLASPGFCWNLHFIPGLHCFLATFSHFLLLKFLMVEESCLLSKAVVVFNILLVVM